MKKILLILLALLLVAPAFAKHRKRKKKAPAKSAIVSAQIFRTGCFGRCPSYKVEIKNDGTAIYTGIRFIKDSGVYKKNIGVAKATNLLNMLLAYKADTCSRMYENRIPDLPGLYYTIKYKDSVKQIISAEWGPHYLQELADSIDALGKKTDNSWKKSK